MRPVHCGIVVGVFLLLAAAAAPAEDLVPPRGESGQTLVATKADLDAGEIYHIYPGEDTQVAVLSDAQLQRTVVAGRRVVGYFVSPFDRGPNDPPISGGYGRLPVASLDCGISPYRDVWLGPALLDAEKHPEITFRILKVEDVKRTSGPKPPEEFTLTLETELVVKGQAVKVRSAAEVRVIPFTFRTMARYPGDLLTLRTSFTLPLADLGLKKPDRQWEDRMAGELKFDVFLLANTVPPDKSLDPALKQPVNVRHLRMMTELRDFDRPDAGYSLARGLMKDAWEDAAALNRIALEVATEDGIRRRDFGLALEAARRACELTGEKDAAMVETRKRVEGLAGAPTSQPGADAVR